MRWLAIILAAPLVAAGIDLSTGTATDLATQATFAPLSGGDAGTATIGTSQADAAITVSALSILTADDILDLSSTDGSWEVHAELVGFTGFGTLQSITLSLRTGATAETQIAIADGSASQTSGNKVDLPSTADTELFAVAALGSTGTIDLHLVLTPDAGGPAIFKTVSITV